jgi:hypothetical protein
MNLLFTGVQGEAGIADYEGSSMNQVDFSKFCIGAASR